MAGSGEVEMGTVHSHPDAVSEGRRAEAVRVRVRNWLVVIVCCAVIITGLAVAFFLRYLAHQAKAGADPKLAHRLGKPIPVRTEAVIERSYEQVVGATALTHASAETALRFGGGGLAGQTVVLAKVAAIEGQKVKRGQVLFEADKELFALALKQKESAATVAQAEYQAVEQLHQRGGASGLEVRSAQIKYELAELEKQVAQRSLEACTIKSPLDGYLDAVEVVPGEQIDSTVDLTTVRCLDPIHVRVDLPQERISEVELGSPAEVVLDSDVEETIAGKVIALSPVVDPETRVLSAVVELPNPRGHIKAGVSGFARFRSLNTAVVIPDTAIVRLGGKASTFVVEEKMAKLRPIRTGPLVETGKRVILAGLAPGEEVVVYGQQDLRDGDKVNENWREWTRRERFEDPDHKAFSP